MKLFKIELRLKRKRHGRTGLEVIVHASSRAIAEEYLADKYTGCRIGSVIELENVSKHFVIADLAA